MKRLFEKTKQSYNAVRNILGELCQKEPIRNAANIAKAGACALGAVLLAGYALAGTITGASVAILGLAGLGGLVTWVHLEDAIKRIKHGKDEAVWKNDVGQKIKSTVGQKMDLENAQTEIYRALSSSDCGHPEGKAACDKAAQKIVSKFQRAAVGVSVIEDIKPESGKFRFARTGPAVVLDM